MLYQPNVVHQINQLKISILIINEDPNKQINILCDIGHYINRSLKQDEIEEILDKILKPELNYKFLVTEKNKNLNIYSYVVLIGYRILQN